MARSVVTSWGDRPEASYSVHLPVLTHVFDDRGEVAMVDELALVHSVAIAKEVDGIEMGVLSDGRSYLTARGLALLCVTGPSTILDQGRRWREGNRTGKLAQMLIQRGITRDSLYVEIVKDGKPTHAYTDDVATIILEYYAFEVTPPNKGAQLNFRRLAQAGLRLFVYQALGYDPNRQLTQSWRNFHDRLTMHSVPRGYFSVFRECADFVLASIRAGLPVDDQTIPDISVGVTWANYWREHRLAEKFGEREKHDHNYPDYYPQAKSNPQEMAVYPVAALGVFREWLETSYLPQKFPAYLDTKRRRGLIAASTVELLLAEVNPPQLSE
jgi:hypothetical protein